MPQRQHVISEWLLRAFARREHGRHVLTGYDKETGHYADHYVDEFLVEVDAHSTDIEREISRIETPAAAVARRLAKRARPYPAGLYAVVDTPQEVVRAGEALSDKGVVAGMRLFVSEHTIEGPKPAERLALARYVGLMYQRAPATEEAIMRFGRAYDRGAQAALDRLLPGRQTGLSTFLASRRERMLDLATRIAGSLASASWFVFRSAPPDTFVLPDSPVAATLSLGHDDEWRAILSPESYAVVIAIGPQVALLMAPRGLVPFTGIEMRTAPRAINRLLWRGAGRYVLASSEGELRAAVDADVRQVSIQPPKNDAAIEEQARKQAEGIVFDVWVQLTIWRPVLARWLHWSGCQLTFGYAIFAARDRDVVMGRPHDPRGREP